MKSFAIVEKICWRGQDTSEEEKTSVVYEFLLSIAIKTHQTVLWSSSCARSSLGMLLVMESPWSCLAINYCAHTHRALRVIHE